MDLGFKVWHLPPGARGVALGERRAVVVHRILLVDSGCGACGLRFKGLGSPALLFRSPLGREEGRAASLWEGGAALGE